MDATPHSVMPLVSLGASVRSGIANPAPLFAVCPISRAMAQSFMPAAIETLHVVELVCRPHHRALRRTASNVETATDSPLMRERVRSPRCGRGEIGERAGFRCQCSKERVGSSPTARTLYLIEFCTRAVIQPPDPTSA